MWTGETEAFPAVTLLAPSGAAAWLAQGASFPSQVLVQRSLQSIGRPTPVPASKEHDVSTRLSQPKTGNLLQGHAATVPAVTPSAIGFVSPASACEVQGLAEPAGDSQEWDVGRGDVISAPPVPVIAVPSRQLVNEGIEGQLGWALLCTGLA